MATERPNKAIHNADGTTTIILERRDGGTMETVVDTADFHKYDLKRYRWYAHTAKGEHTFYAQSNTPVGGESRTRRMHILLTGEKGYDHKDRDGLNNRRNNLREASASQQQVNTKTYINNTTGERGAYLDKRSGKYTAWFYTNGKGKNLGRYDTAEEAGAIARAARIAAFGEFAAA
jgi:hypothetical protein